MHDLHISRFFDQNHPEKLDDEYFLGNFKVEDFYKLIWKNKRCGNRAYSTDGVLLPSEWGMLPVFVNSLEYDQHFQKGG